MRGAKPTDQVLSLGWLLLGLGGLLHCCLQRAVEADLRLVKRELGECKRNFGISKGEKIQNHTNQNKAIAESICADDPATQTLEAALYLVHGLTNSLPHLHGT